MRGQQNNSTIAGRKNMKLLKMLVGRIRDWRARRIHERLADEAVEEQLSKLTDNEYLDRFSGGSRG